MQMLPPGVPPMLSYRCKCYRFQSAEEFREAKSLPESGLRGNFRRLVHERGQRVTKPPAEILVLGCIPEAFLCHARSR